MTKSFPVLVDGLLESHLCSLFLDAVLLSVDLGFLRVHFALLAVEFVLEARRGASASTSASTATSKTATDTSTNAAVGWEASTLPGSAPQSTNPGTTEAACTSTDSAWEMSTANASTANASAANAGTTNSASNAASCHPDGDLADCSGSRDSVRGAEHTGFNLLEVIKVT
ncbi:hypothetical protein P5E45_14970, partial [Clostridium perfringens]|nr:hypothetical protein [Clostridium perfringens]